MQLPRLAYGIRICRGALNLNSNFFHFNTRPLGSVPLPGGEEISVCKEFICTREGPELPLHRSGWLCQKSFFLYPLFPLSPLGRLCGVSLSCSSVPQLRWQKSGWFHAGKEKKVEV